MRRVLWYGWVILLFFWPYAASVASSSVAANAVGYQVLDLPYPKGNQQKTLTLAIWYPTTATPSEYVYGGATRGNVALEGPPDSARGPYPLLVFSHGYGGSGLGAVYFTQALAARGWIVVSMDHHDAFSAVRIRTGQLAEFDRKGLLVDARHIASSGIKDRDRLLYRVREMGLALNGIINDARFGHLIDQKRIVVGGHSLGGFSALGVCGTLPQYYDPRIKALLLFSTGAGGYLFSDEELQQVHMPTLILVGAKERNQKRGDATMWALATKIHRNIAQRSFLFEIADAGHFSFNNRFTETWAARRMSGSDAIFDEIRRRAFDFLDTQVLAP